MAICGPAAIPHSYFLGGPNVWTELDRDKQRAWQRRQHETHGKCGIHPDVWDPERGGDPGVLRLASRTCAACELEETGRDSYDKKRLPGEYQVWDLRAPTTDINEAEEDATP